MPKLPEKWCIKRNPKNAQAINDWANKGKRSELFNSDKDWLYYDSEKIQPVHNCMSFDTGREPVLEGYKIISFTQFKRLIK